MYYMEFFCCLKATENNPTQFFSLWLLKLNYYVNLS